MEFFKKYYQSPIGLIEIKAIEDALVSIKFLTDGTNIEDNSSGNEITADAISQLEEYFNHKRKVFDIPLHLNGTDFQVKVWEKLLEIPFGKTTTYGKIAIKLGTIKNMRAVGAANGKNPLAIIVPCHRVVGENGELVGYAGGLWRKKWLLEHEASEKQLTISF